MVTLTVRREGTDEQFEVELDDERGERFERACEVLGLTPSELFQRAIRAFMEAHPAPLCRCPEGVCFLHPSQSTCGMRQES